VCHGCRKKTDGLSPQDVERAKRVLDEHDAAATTTCPHDGGTAVPRRSGRRRSRR
jgi:hypothetical protein